jgi:hypothetical protein
MTAFAETARPLSRGRGLAGIAGLLLLGLVAVPGRGLAELASEPPASPEGSAPEESAGAAGEVERARMHFEQGLRLTRREHWDAALVEFERSLSLHPTQAAALNRALCLQRLRRYGEAIAAFEGYLERYGGEVDEAQRDRARRILEEMRALVTPLTVSVSVDGATVVVDEREVGESPLAEPVPLLSGAHVIEVRMDGYRPARRQVVVVAGEERTERFVLLEPPRMAMVRVESNVEGATLLLDGQEAGVTPWSGVLPQGVHEVAVRAPGHETARTGVTLTADEDRVLSLTLHPSRRIHRGWFWSAASLAAAGALTTAGLGVTVLVLDGRYDYLAADAAERQAEGRTWMLATDIALGGTLAAAAAALVLGFFVDFHPEGADAARAGTGPAPGSAWMLRPAWGAAGGGLP